MITDSRRYLALTYLTFLLAGCDHTATIEGIVVDTRDQPIPGVAVTADNGEHEAISNALGAYTLRSAPGMLTLNYLKTGYTPGRLEVEGAAASTIEAVPVKLIPLPPDKGVYLYESFRYLPAGFIQPKPYVQKGGGSLFGTKKTADLATLSSTPTLICYQLPSIDATIYRLEKVEATQPNARSDAYTESIWAPVESIPVLASPIDEPGRLLLELQIGAPLSPGAYAVHWGALDGYTSTEPLIYLFKVVDPDAPGEAPEAEEETTPQPPRERRAGDDSPQEDGGGY